jgi:hypothetical protein
LPTPPPAGESEPPLPPLYDPHWPDFPPVIVPPVYIPPGEEPPCDEDNPDDDECDEPEEPEEPPVDAPEPGTAFILGLAGLVYWRFRPAGRRSA